MPMKLASVEEQKALIPTESIRQCFLRREDIWILSESEQEAKWNEHLKYLEKFRTWLSGVPTYVVQGRNQEDEK